MDEITYNTLIKGIAKVSGVAEVENALEDMHKNKVRPGTITLNVVCEAFAAAGDVHKLSAMFDDLRARGAKPDVMAYSHVIEAACRAGELETAEKYFKSMTDDGLDPSTQICNALVSQTDVKRKNTRTSSNGDGRCFLSVRIPRSL